MKAYVIPVSAYLAVAIAGGYGTGREVVEFFSVSGAYGGLIGIALAASLISIITAISFEFARIFKVYDYRSFIKELIGPFWFLFEILYVLLFLIVLAVVTAAAGSMMSDRLGISENFGLFSMIAIIGCLLFFGRSVVEKSLVIVAVLLFSAFVYYFYSVWAVDGNDIVEQLNVASISDRSWLVPAFQFAMYSATAVTIVLFSARGIEKRVDALVSGTIAGVLFMIPGLVFHISFLGRLDQVIIEDVPIYWMIDQVSAPGLMPIYLVAMFLTFLGTGLGFLQAVNERLDAWSTSRGGKPFGQWAHVGVGIAGLLISAGLGQFGIIALIAKGYGTISWGFLFIFVLPVISIGVVKIKRASNQVEIQKELV